MQEDKTYMWLIVIAFVALLIATTFALMELNELQTEQGQQQKQP